MDAASSEASLNDGAEPMDISPASFRKTGEPTEAPTVFA
jgi:hypothetical protein